MDEDLVGQECEVCFKQATNLWGRYARPCCDNPECEETLFDGNPSEGDMSMED